MGLESDCQSTCDNIIYQSGDTPLNFTMSMDCGKSFPIGAASEIMAIFQTLVNPPVILKLSLSQIVISNGGGGGQFTCTMSQANALLLALGLINVEVRITIGGVITVAELIGQVTVVPSLFPGY